MKIFVEAFTSFNQAKKCFKEKMNKKEVNTIYDIEVDKSGFCFIVYKYYKE